MLDAIANHDELAFAHFDSGDAAGSCDYSTGVKINEPIEWRRRGAESVGGVVRKGFQIFLGAAFRETAVEFDALRVVFDIVIRDVRTDRFVFRRRISLEERKRDLDGDDGLRCLAPQSCHGRFKKLTVKAESYCRYVAALLGT